MTNIRKNVHRKKHNKKTARFPEIKTTYLNRNLKIPGIF